ncbi:TIGR03086 family metal-binding protein [Streptomyces sp. NPDC054765]
MDPRLLFLRSLDQFEELTATVPPLLLERPTPCAEFDLRALLGHVVGAVHRIAYVAEGGRALDLYPQVDFVADDDWPGAVARARTRAAAAWADDAVLERMVEMSWGTMPGRAALNGYVMEVATHTWDVAQVLDTPAQLDPAIGEFAMDIAQRALPADGRGPHVPFGPVRQAPPDADPYTRLAAWTGREVGTR